MNIKQNLLVEEKWSTRHSQLGAAPREASFGMQPKSCATVT
jgi:hypothetical protein